MGSATDVAEGLADALEQLRIAVERGEHAREDLGDVVQAGLQQRLRLHPLDVELDLAEPRRGPGMDLDEVPGLGEHGEMDPQVIQLELDLVDLDDRRVDVDVDRLVDLLGIDDRVVRQVLVGALRLVGVLGLAGALGRSGAAWTDWSASRSTRRGRCCGWIESCRCDRVDPRLGREPAALEPELPDFVRELPDRDPEFARAMWFSSPGPLL